MKLADAWLLGLVAEDGSPAGGARYAHVAACRNCDAAFFQLRDKKGIPCTEESVFCRACRAEHRIGRCGRCEGELLGSDADGGLCSDCLGHLMAKD